MSKNKKSTKMTALLVALVLVTSLFVGGTIARYVTSTSSEDEARVAVWGINAVGPTEMDLFNATYVENGVTVAQSNNGDNIIAPGTHNDNQFKIVNTDDTLAPEVMYEIRINLDDSEIDPLILNNPSIQWRLDGGSYGTWEETKAKILMLSGDASGVRTYAPGTMEHEFANGKTHTIGWQWIMDNNNDVMDTEMGNAVANGEEIKATIKVSVTARQVDTDTTGLLEGDGSLYNINDPQPLTFRSVAPMNELQKVIVNDQELEEETHYTVDSGSTVITLLKSFLETLSNGKYTITIVSENTTTNASFNVADAPIVHNGIIPEGGTYYIGIPLGSEGERLFGDYDTYTKKLVAGDKFPEPQAGDIYVYGDFEYGFNLASTLGSWGSTWNQNGWSLAPIDKRQTEYSNILTTIANKNVVNMDNAFYNNSNLTVTPVIPTTIKYMQSAFSGCSSLSGEVPALPENVEGLAYAFSHCTNLTTVNITIPETVDSMDSLFSGCSNLTGTVTIHAEEPAIPGAFAGVFDGTTKPITIKGTSPYLEEIAAEFSNVTIAQ